VKPQGLSVVPTEPDKPDPAWKNKARKVYRLLDEHDLSPLVEISQSGSAAHVWVFFKRPIAARLVRGFWRGILDHLNVPVPEIYPRQDELTGKGLGNLVRYPLWNQSRFVDVTDGWTTLPPIKTMSAVTPVSLKRLERVAREIGFSLHAPAKMTATKGYTGSSCELPERVQRLLEQDERLAARWAGSTEGLTDTSRSSIVMSVATLLVYRYLPTPEIEAAIRHWCEKENYEKGNRDEWITGVMAKAYELAQDRWEGQRRRTTQLPRDTPELIRRAHYRAVARKIDLKTRRMP
jgi:hypothetical protein